MLGAVAQGDPLSMRRGQPAASERRRRESIGIPTHLSLPPFEARYQSISRPRTSRSYQFRFGLVTRGTHVLLFVRASQGPARWDGAERESRSRQNSNSPRKPSHEARHYEVERKQKLGCPSTNEDGRNRFRSLRRHRGGVSHACLPGLCAISNAQD